VTREIPTHRLSRSGWVLFLSDVHIGANQHAEKEFDLALDWAREHEATLVLNGDIIENSVAGSDKDVGEKLLGQAFYPTEQYLVAKSKFAPFAKRGRIAGMTRGNHESRSRRLALIDLSEILALDLGVPYLGIGGLLRLCTANGAHEYLIALHHGRSGARNIWFELDRLTALYPEACLVAAGHNHALAARKIAHITLGNGRESFAERWQVRTGTFHRYADYVREMSLPPGRIGAPVALFSSARTTRSVHVDCERLSWAGL